MKSVILFGGGDGGGLIITDSGVKPIPPFDPEVLMTLKATAALVTAVDAAGAGKSQRKLSRLATSLAAVAVEQVEDVVGPLSGESALVFQDDDRGFTCGSTGKPPRPLPWPPSKLPPIGDMVSQGVVQADLVGFLRAVRDSKIKLNNALENPVAAAKELAMPLSDKSARDLRLIAPSRTAAIKDSTEREIVTFFHKVAADGSHLDTWFSRPYEVSQDLGVKLSEAALERLATNGAAAAFGGSTITADGKTAIAIGVGWAVVCIVVGIVFGETERPIDVIVQDTSGLAKI
jgi:hypothetical protein